ncbi:benzil reductase ((S)-benzoin forming) [Inhella inkyongensis]|uniref:Benzil reductase ((S)-benzoin forming) n=1 Tax=Inhella inkyongensis TaxID=392593 RepID=A0A840S847_9BURK|nr:SDR family NAD(P)-dependent oxidoreductase [Inhella inkyongensis]MBB5205186.1 benzil reductase ((S)-benzoin forming) [Inhella inkyongensis]
MRMAFVTGGSQGLGLALCQQLQGAGYRVVEFSRSAPHPFSVPLDLCDPEAALRTVQQALQTVDPASCTELLLIHNAGSLAPIGPTWRQPPAALLAALNTNFSAALLVLSELMRHFRDTPGRKRLVNISSGAALKGYAGWTLYCASKAGLEGFIRALAVEEQHHPQPFTPLSIDPGVIDTGMQALIRATPARDFPEVERFKRRKLEGGLAAPEAVAAGILSLLASELTPGGRYEAPLLEPR